MVYDGIMGPYAGDDYNLTYVQSRVDSNTFTMGNPMPESTLSPPSQELWIWPLVLYKPFNTLAITDRFTFISF